MTDYPLLCAARCRPAERDATYAAGHPLLAPQLPESTDE